MRDVFVCRRAIISTQHCISALEILYTSCLFIISSRFSPDFEQETMQTKQKLKGK